MEHEGDAQGAHQEREYKVFVGGISYKVDEEALKSMFEKFGPINAVIQVDRLSGRPRGFGFVSFKDQESVQDAIREMHNKEIDGRTISVKDAIPMDQIKPGSRMGERRDARAYAPRDRAYPPAADRYADRGYPADRYAAYDRGYDRYASYDPRGGYDRGYAGYDRYAYGGGGGYERDPYYRDPYATREPHETYPAAGSSYDRPAYDARYDTRYSDYGRYPEYDRAAGGPDRRAAYPAPRPGPYDRSTPDARRR